MRIQYANAYIVFVELERRRLVAYDPAEDAALHPPIPHATVRRVVDGGGARRGRYHRLLPGRPLILGWRLRAVGPEVGAEHGEAPRRGHLGVGKVVAD